LSNRDCHTNLSLYKMNSILIIDDEEVDFIIHSKIIKLGKFADKISYQNSGVSALQYLTEITKSDLEWPTHIFLDINMPQMNGFEFLEALSKLEIFHANQTKIYILSSSINPKDREKAKEFELIKDYLMKPMTFETASKVFDQDSY
jgi:CheY-like chemotaxis protein